MITITPKIKETLEWIIYIVIAIILALIVRYYIGTPTEVQHSSMYPTLIQGQRLWLNRLAIIKNEKIERGEIVTFEAPSVNKIDMSNPVAIYQNEPQNLWDKFLYYVLQITKRSYIKRVIAFPGEHVEIANGKVYINGEELKETYLQENVTTFGENGENIEFIVPEGTLFLMGDNREKSMDCRSFGCIPINKIESKVAIRIWPLNLFGEVK